MRSVGDDVARTTGRSDHSHPSPVWQRARTEQASSDEQLLQASRADDAQLAHGCIDDGVITRDRAGVGKSRPLAGRTAPDLERDDWLAAFECPISQRRKTCW